MTPTEQDHLVAMMWKAGQHLAARLRNMTDDPAATAITFDRDEALLALALIEAAVDAIEKGR